MAKNIGIVVVGKVVVNREISTKSGNFHRLTLDAGNGKHHEFAVLRKGADSASTKTFNNAAVGDVVTLGKCFIDAFVYRDNDARVTVRAGSCQ